MNTLNEKVAELRQLLLTPEVPAEEALRGLPPLAEVEAAIGALEARLSRLRALRAVLLLLDQGPAPPGDFWPRLSARARNAICHAAEQREVEIRAPRDVAKLSRRLLLEQRHCGQLTLQEIEDALAPYGLTLPEM
jgi:hypothetical protein